jgi:hypothetical protein
MAYGDAELGISFQRFYMAREPSRSKWMQPGIALNAARLSLGMLNLFQPASKWVQIRSLIILS